MHNHDRKSTLASMQAIAQRSKESDHATTHWDKLSFEDSLVVYQVTWQGHVHTSASFTVMHV